MKFGEKLKDLRQKRKLTQGEVATSIGVSRRAYIAYEQENVRPRKQETYDKLARTLGCDVNYLRIDDNAINAGTVAALGTLGIALGSIASSPIGFATALQVFTTYLGFRATRKIFDRSEETKEPLTYTNDMLLQYEKAQKQFAAIAIGVLYRAAAKKGIQCQQGNLKDIGSTGIRPDDFIIVKNQNIESWWLIFWAKDPKLDEHVIMFPEDRAGALISRFTTSKSDPKRMATIVVDDIELFEAVCRYKGHNSYRGNLSVIMVDTNEVTVCKEEIISSYDEDHPEEDSYISVL